MVLNIILIRFKGAGYMESILKKLIFKYSGIQVVNLNENLLKLPIPVVNFIYIITELEDIYNIRIIKVMDNENFEVFTINNLMKKLTLYIKN